METPNFLPGPDDDLNILDLLIVLARHKWLLIGMTGCFTVVAVFYSLLATPLYQGRITLLPPQQQSAAAMMSQIGNLPTGMSMAAMLGLKNPSDLYVGLLQSQSIRRALVNRFKLRSEYQTKTVIDAVEALKNRTDVSAGKDGLITVSFLDPDPTRASVMANAYVEELQLLMKRLALTESGQRRVFFEDHLKSTKNQLVNAEVALKQVQEKTGIVQLESQGKATIDAIAALRAQIVAAEIQLQVMAKSMTENNPEYRRTQAELNGLKQQLKQADTGNGPDDDKTLLAKSRTPEMGLEYVRKLREVKYYETLFELMARQYEMAKLDEANQGSVVQVVDYATVPEKKAKPQRLVIVVLAMIGGLMLSIILAFMLEALSRIRSSPDQANRLSTLKQLLFRG